MVLMLNMNTIPSSFLIAVGTFLLPPKFASSRARQIRRFNPHTFIIYNTQIIFNFSLAPTINTSTVSTNKENDDF
jgi:hypothetical protein